MRIFTQTPITVSTISDLAESRMTLGLYCLECDRWAEILPQDWLDAGKPDVNYVEQKFKCGQLHTVVLVYWLYLQVMRGFGGFIISSPRCISSRDPSNSL